MSALPSSHPASYRVGVNAAQRILVDAAKDVRIKQQGAQRSADQDMAEFYEGQADLLDALIAKVAAL